MAKKSKTPWPTKAVMHQIYEQKLWGGQEFDFYSGSGSHDLDIIEPYINKVITFFNQHPNLVVCDLGCGDFNIGKHFVSHVKQYIALDIVEPLIYRNKKRYKYPNLSFGYLDIANHNWPKADCVILRQVLQHLPNNEILSVVNKLQNYKYIIITEHLPVGNFSSNIDMISSQGIRLKKGSGVDLLKAPFNLKIKERQVLYNYVLKNNKGCILTQLYTVF